jgi:ribosomal protein S12 methylthiotransferase
LRSSFITGFPGESEAAFANLARFIEREQFDRVGVFTYSQEENTAAGTMDGQIPERIKRARRNRLMELQARIALRKNKDLIGHTVQVMVEGALGGRATRLRGRTSTQAPEIDGMVILRGSAAAGELVEARVEQARTYDLIGEIIGASA